jgi:hypothetical protein
MHKRLLYFAIMFILAAGSIGTYLSYTVEIARKPVLVDAIESRNWSAVASFYAATTPELEGWQYFGNASAPLIIVSITDNKANGTMAYIVENYADSNKARYYALPYVNYDDVTGNSARFKYASSKGTPEAVKALASYVEQNMVHLNERFIIGFGPRMATVIDGIPTTANLQQTIRDYQTLLGD